MELSKSPLEVVLVLTTAPDDERASSWARTLVDERLAACCNVHAAMTSFYRWKGAVECEAERQLVLKTTRDRVPALRARLEALHSYELPEFVVIRVEEGGEAYLRWVIDSTRPED